MLIDVNELNKYEVEGFNLVTIVTIINRKKHSEKHSKQLHFILLTLIVCSKPIIRSLYQ